MSERQTLRAMIQSTQQPESWPRAPRTQGRPIAALFALAPRGVVAPATNCPSFESCLSYHFSQLARQRPFCADHRSIVLARRPEAGVAQTLQAKIHTNSKSQI